MLKVSLPLLTVEWRILISNEHQWKVEMEDKNNLSSWIFRPGVITFFRSNLHQPPNKDEVMTHILWLNRWQLLADIIYNCLDLATENHFPNPAHQPTAVPMDNIQSIKNIIFHITHSCSKKCKEDKSFVSAINYLREG